MELADYINLGILIVAVIAAVISVFQLKSHNAKENNKLLSQLNRRYLGSNELQAVVRYLREIEASDFEPNAYQVELFLRFFEELGVYLKTKSISKNDVKEFFGFYFNQYEHSDRGRILKEKIHNEDTDKHLPYLGVYRKKINK
ncbi:MAG: hypothetical protein K6E93_10390 [Bacteroidales bacterium]|nr:hypothetical protein [Bacteroidales bacterium]